jgi:hypothetical protein
VPPNGADAPRSGAQKKPVSDRLTGYFAERAPLKALLSTPNTIDTFDTFPLSKYR